MVSEFRIDFARRHLVKEWHLIFVVAKAPEFFRIALDKRGVQLHTCKVELQWALPR